MQLLFLTPQLPFPPRQGTTIRNFNLIRHLAQRHTVKRARRRIVSGIAGQLGIIDFRIGLVHGAASYGRTRRWPKGAPL